jgi:hypothetical protein
MSKGENRFPARTIEGILYLVAAFYWIWVGVSEQYPQKAMGAAITFINTIGNAVTYHPRSHQTH